MLDTKKESLTPGQIEVVRDVLRRGGPMPLRVLYHRAARGRSVTAGTAWHQGKVIGSVLRSVDMLDKGTAKRALQHLIDKGDVVSVMVPVWTQGSWPMQTKKSYRLVGLWQDLKLMGPGARVQARVSARL